MNKSKFGTFIILLIAFSTISADPEAENPKEIFYSGYSMRIQKNGMFHINMVHLAESFINSIYGNFASGYLNQVNGNYKECIDELNNVINEKSNSDFRLVSEAYFYMGICNYDLGNYDLAIKNYTQTIAFDKENNFTETYLNSMLERAKTYNRIKKFDLAKKDISSAINRIEKEKKFDQYFNLDQLHMDRIALNVTLHEYVEAIPDCDWIIKNSKDKKDMGYLQRGQIRYKFLLDYDRGFADFKKAFEINPNNFSAIASSIEVLNSRKEYEEIPQYISKALKIKPKLGVLYYTRGYYFEQINKRKDACQDMKESLKYTSENVIRDSEGYYSFDHIPSANSFINSMCK